MQSMRSAIDDEVADVQSEYQRLKAHIELYIQEVRSAMSATRQPEQPTERAPSPPSEKPGEAVTAA